MAPLGMESIVGGGECERVSEEERGYMRAWKRRRSCFRSSSGGGDHRTGTLTSLWMFCSGDEGRIEDD